MLYYLSFFSHTHTHTDTKIYEINFIQNSENIYYYSDCEVKKIYTPKNVKKNAPTLISKNKKILTALKFKNKNKIPKIIQNIHIIFLKILIIIFHLSFHVRKNFRPFNFFSSINAHKFFIFYFSF